MIEKDVLQKAELPMWQIIAFYMSKTDGEKAYNIGVRARPQTVAPAMY